MKRLLVMLMVACLVLSVFSTTALAEIVVEDDLVFVDETDEPDDTLPPGEEGDSEPTDTPVPIDMGEFVVGATTRLNGMFFTNMWGNNTCDIDVRSMIHGYSPVVWTTQAAFEVDTNVVYGMAAYTTLDGDKLYMIEIQEDLCYNDGTPITAYDYAFSLLLLTAPEITALDGLTTNTSFMVGYEEYNSGESEVFAGVRVFDEYTFGIEIKHEYLPFFFEMGMLDVIPYPISVIAPGCEVADDGEGAYIRNIDPDYPEPLFTSENLERTILDPDTGYLSHPYVTSGPYSLTSFDWDTREVTFEINENYKGDYQGQKPTIDNIRFKSVLPDTMMDELASGEVQLLNKVVAAESITEGMGLVMDQLATPKSYQRMGFGFMTFSCEQGPTQYEAVRKAIAYAFDTNEFTRLYNENYGRAVYGYYGLGQWMVRLVEGNVVGLSIEAEEEQAEWDKLSLGGLETYDFDVERAKKLLVDDGWVLNENGESFTEGVDTVRYKDIDGELMGLSLKWGKMEDSIAAQIIEDILIEPLSQIGISVEITEVAFVDLLQHYYRQVDREYDMMYLATNFIAIFDPYFVFNTADEYQGKINTTGYIDEKLEELAFDLRSTPPGNLLEYCQKWVTFQEYFNEVLPMFPIYSNMYFDFHTPYLWGYDPSEAGWPVAILYSTYTYNDPSRVGGQEIGGLGGGDVGDIEDIEDIDEIDDIEDMDDIEDLE